MRIGDSDRSCSGSNASMSMFTAAYDTDLTSNKPNVVILPNQRASVMPRFPVHMSVLFVVTAIVHSHAVPSFMYSPFATHLRSNY